MREFKGVEETRKQRTLEDDRHYSVSESRKMMMMMVVRAYRGGQLLPAHAFHHHVVLPYKILRVM